jgi:hypothetical protein
MRLSPLAAAAVLLVGACGAPTPQPTLTPAPPPTAAATPVPTLDPATADVQDAFLTNVNDLTSEVESLATAQCADLTAETRDNPSEVAEIHGFAAALQRIGASQAALDSDDVRSALADLGKAISQLDTSLNTCGIKTS